MLTGRKRSRGPEQQAAVLQHRAPQPPLGAAEDLMPVAGVGIGRGHDHIAPGPPVEAEQPPLVAAGLVAAWMQRGGDAVPLQEAHERGMESVVEDLCRCPPGMLPRHGHGVGEVAAVEDATSAARPPHEADAGRVGPRPGVGEPLKSAQRQRRLGPAIEPHQRPAGRHRFSRQDLVGRHVVGAGGGRGPTR